MAQIVRPGEHDTFAWSRRKREIIRNETERIGELCDWARRDQLAARRAIEQERHHRRRARKIGQEAAVIGLLGAREGVAPETFREGIAYGEVVSLCPVRAKSDTDIAGGR